MKICLVEIVDRGYVFGDPADPPCYDANPLDEDIAQAVAKAKESGITEKRRWHGAEKQDVLQEVFKEATLEAQVARLKRYHAERVAHYVVNGWESQEDKKHPIAVKAFADSLHPHFKWLTTEGVHRLKAIRFLGVSEIEVKVEE